MTNTVKLREQFPHTPDEKTNHKCVDCGALRAYTDTWDMLDPCWVKMANELQNFVDYVAYQEYQRTIPAGMIGVRWWCMDEELKEACREQAKRIVKIWKTAEDQTLKDIEKDVNVIPSIWRRNEDNR